MRILRTALCLALVCLMTAQPLAAAVPRLDALSADIKNAQNTSAAEVTSRMMISVSVTDAEAAERLYYLGMMSGVGVVNGHVSFALERPLTRLESIVMTARLLGVETEILEKNEPHRFTDVPEWGSPYVGYFLSHGLLDNMEGTLFEPDAAVSTNAFMHYMYHALGYEDCDRTYLDTKASLYAIQAGICTEAKPVITRGDAAQLMYRTLNTSCAGSEKMLSEYFVESELIGYNDAMFLLWNNNKIECNAYIASQGYTTEKILPDGKYTVMLNGSTRCLNVAVEGGNNDYEGVGVTVWKRTDDISQKFRIERTDRGTYHVYSCASGGGFHRMLGIGYYGTAGLYKVSSRYAGEYYIRYSNANDGTWQLISAADPTKTLGSADTRNGCAVQLCSSDDPKFKTSWSFEFDGVVNEAGLEFALFPSGTLNVTQGAYDHYSHQKQNALDITTTNGSVYAPFTGKIVRIDRGYSRYNTVWLESSDKVVFADGSIDYMTVVFMHDNNVSDLSVGQILTQGEYFYDMGVAGGATGPHVHIAVIRGQYSKKMGLTGSGNVRVEDALFLPADVKVITSYGLDWVYLTP